MSFLRRAFERRDLFASGMTHVAGAEMGSSAIPSNGAAGWGGSASGYAINDRSAFALPAFYACVRLLADTVASLPWDAYRKRDTDRREIDPMPSLLASPAGTEMSEFDFKQVVVTSLATRGNFYALVTERDGLGYPTAMLPLHPDWIIIDRNPDTGARRWRLNGSEQRWEDLFHIPFLRLPGQDTGLSPIAAARHSLGLGLAAQDFGAKYFRDGATPSSVLETDAQMDQAMVERVQKTWIQSHGGRRFPAVTTGGLKWRQVSISPEESQFLQTREFQDIDICKLMGVPPHMISIVDKSTSWGTGIEQQSIGFVTYSLRPTYLSRIESALSACLPRGTYCRFNVNALLRGDIKSRYESYRVAIETGWMNPNEVRALEERAPIPKGDLYRQPLNFGPLGAEPEETTPNDNTDAGADAPGSTAGDAGVARIPRVRGPLAG